MVIDDSNLEGPKFKSKLSRGSENPPNENLASPLDRLAATTVDCCMVLTPSILFLVSPLRKMMTESMLLQQESQFAVIAALSVLLSVFVVWLYQSVMISRYGATLGKLFVNLRVVQVGTNLNPRFGQASLRAIVWMAECLFLFPFLAVFSHQQRRAIHDRLSDTAVVSLKKPIGAPEFWERAFTRGVYAALCAFFVLLGVGIFKGIVDDLSDQSKVLTLLEDRGELCAAVGDAAKTWPQEKVSYGTERLNVAMAMYAAGIISKSCLGQETEHLASQVREEEPLLYLAQSFVQSEDPTLSNEYLERICKLGKDSEACSMSKVISAWSDGNWTKVDQIFDNTRGTFGLHMAVWSIRHLMKQQRYFDAINYIEVISPQKTLAPFLNVQRVKAYWQLNRFAEARAVAAGSLDVVDLYDSVELSAWLCQAELEQSCSYEASLSCRALEKYMNTGTDLMTDRQLVLARVQKIECSSQPKGELEKLADEVPDDRVRSYMNALVINHRKNPRQAREEMSTLLKVSSKDEVGSLAKRRLIDWAVSKNALEPYYKEWLEAEEQDYEWVKLGKSLFYKYYSFGAFSKALNIGKDLMSTPVASAKFYEAMVTSAYNSGKRKDAFALLKVYRNLETDTATLRMPASESAFQVISRILEKENGTQSK